jgi:hypothetical protein
VRFDLAISGVAGLKQEVFTRSDLKKWLDIRMPPVMACARVIAEATVAVDMDRFHGNTIT